MLISTASSRVRDPNHPMWGVTVRHSPVVPVPVALTVHVNPKVPAFSLPIAESFRFGSRFRLSEFKVSAAKKQLPELRNKIPGPSLIQFK